MSIIKVFLFFIFAGLCEIGGGYLVWIYFKDQKSIWYLLLGIVILGLYGFVATLQPTDNFGKVFASYGGVFIVMSLLWGWIVDKTPPDNYDIVGCLIIMLGVFVMFFGGLKVQS